jgi:hypothetical protein
MSKVEDGSVKDFLVTGDIGGGFGAAVTRFDYFYGLYEERFGEAPPDDFGIDNLVKAVGEKMKNHPLDKYLD